jgi:hypothetical protein
VPVIIVRSVNTADATGQTWRADEVRHHSSPSTSLGAMVMEGSDRQSSDRRPGRGLALGIDQRGSFRRPVQLDPVDHGTGRLASRWESSFSLDRQGVTASLAIQINQSLAILVVSRLFRTAIQIKSCLDFDVAVP